MAKTWIQTLERRKLEPRALLPSMVGSIREIAHALAGKFRYTCQTEARYSVAEHAVLGSRVLPPAFAGAFLLHELSEVYLPDIAGPVKPYDWIEIDERDLHMFADASVVRATHPSGRPMALIQWVDLERQHTRVILRALGLGSLEPLVYSPEVKCLDTAMLSAEKRDLWSGPEPEPWGLPYEAPPGVSVEAWDPLIAEREFLARFEALFGSVHRNERPVAQDTAGAP